MIRWLTALSALLLLVPTAQAVDEADAAFPAWRETPVEALMDHTSGLADADFVGRDWLMTARADPASLRDQRAALAAQR